MSRYPPPSALLPHAGRAILIDAMLEDRPDEAVAVADIGADHPWLEPGLGVPVWVGLEMMAQVVAAHGGLIEQAQGGPPRRGMLVGSRRFRGHVPYFALGTRLVIRVTHAYGQLGGGMAVVDSRIEADGKLLAEASLTIIEESADA